MLMPIKLLSSFLMVTVPDVMVIPLASEGARNRSGECYAIGIMVAQLGLHAIFDHIV